MASEITQRCAWTYDEDMDYYETGCQHAYCLNDGTLEENKHRYCPYCGGWIEEVKVWRTT